MMRFPLAIVCVVSVSVMSGCLVSARNHTTTTGRYISPSTMQQIEPGRTKADFVIATLGTPTTKTTLDDGSEVWRYEYRRKTQSSGTVFLLLNSDNYTERDGSVYVVMRDGVVEKTWRDN